MCSLYQAWFTIFDGSDSLFSKCLSEFGIPKLLSTSSTGVVFQVGDSPILATSAWLDIIFTFPIRILRIWKSTCYIFARTDRNPDPGCDRSWYPVSLWGLEWSRFFVKGCHDIYVCIYIYNYMICFNLMCIGLNHIRNRLYELSIYVYPLNPFLVVQKTPIAPSQQKSDPMIHYDT